MALFAANVEGRTRTDTSPLCAGTAAVVRTVTVDTTLSTKDGQIECVDALLASSGRGSDGKISLVEAILAINNDALRRPGSSYTITFKLASGSPISYDATFEINAPNTTIDGDTTTDGVSRPDIVLLGADHIPAFTLRGDHIALRHLALPEIVIEGASAHRDEVRGCYVGTNVDGVTPLGTLGSGIIIRGGAHDNTIDDNVIAGRTIGGGTTVGTGVWIEKATGNLLRGNRIGVDVKGAPLANEVGVIITDGGEMGAASADTTGNHIGGARLSEACNSPCNVISGNAYQAVQIRGAKATNNFIEGNYIGVNPSGTVPVPNATSASGTYPAVAVDAARRRTSSAAIAAPSRHVTGRAT